MFPSAYQVCIIRASELLHTTGTFRKQFLVTTQRSGNEIQSYDPHERSSHHAEPYLRLLRVSCIIHLSHNGVDGPIFHCSPNLLYRFDSLPFVPNRYTGVAVRMKTISAGMSTKIGYVLGLAACITELEFLPSQAW